MKMDNTTTVICLYFPVLKEDECDLSSEGEEKFAEIELCIQENASCKSVYGCQGVILYDSKKFWKEIEFQISNGNFRVAKSNITNKELFAYTQSNIKAVLEEIEIESIDGNGRDSHT